MSSDASAPYQQPYQSVVPHDPSFDDMLRVVKVQQQRPVIPDSWQHDPVSSVTLLGEGGGDSPGLYPLEQGMDSWQCDPGSDEGEGGVGYSW